jgi:hypothetical protein
MIYYMYYVSVIYYVSVVEQSAVREELSADVKYHVDRFHPNLRAGLPKL